MPGMTEYAPASVYRDKEGLGLWEHRGKVVAVGVGHSPTARRWDGKPETSVEDLIAGVEDGILIDGDGSYSIDQQRYNFQFGGDAFWAIKGGKKQGMISRVAYQSRTTDFWQACDGIAGRSYWQQWGAANDGKGEPEQINGVSHGCSPARSLWRKLLGMNLRPTVNPALAVKTISGSPGWGEIK